MRAHNNLHLEYLPCLRIDLIDFICPYASMTTNQSVLMSSMMFQCKSKKYGPQLAQQLIRAPLQRLARAYASELASNSELEVVFHFIAKFLGDKNPLTIQYAAIETLSILFDSDRIRAGGHPTTTAQLNLKQFHHDLFKKLDKLFREMEAVSNEITDNVVSDIDRSSRMQSVHIQLFSAFICRNYILRQNGCFLLAEWCYRNEISRVMFVHSVCYYNLYDRFLFNFIFRMHHCCT